MVPPNFHSGCVIPAHPLALTADRNLDERRQRALTRYYLDAGAGGLAVGVHTTQFAIHDPDVGLLEPVLALAATEVHSQGRDDLVLIAGVVGETAQAVKEAELAASLGYHAALVSPVGVRDPAHLVERAAAVGEVLPVIGFYLQPAVGGLELSADFWNRLLALECLIGIKVAPFDRYRSLDVLRAVAHSGRADDVALYTGNDDHILADLIAEYVSPAEDEPRSRVRFVGGLLGQWSMWTYTAVKHFQLVRASNGGDAAATRKLLSLDSHLTDANGAIFDVHNGFAGCIAGTNEVLRRQGLLSGNWCVDNRETLSPGQVNEIDRIWRSYPHLRDDDFVKQNLDQWLSS